jgi:hypothetical protein
MIQELGDDPDSLRPDDLDVPRAAEHPDPSRAHDPGASRLGFRVCKSATDSIAAGATQQQQAKKDGFLNCSLLEEEEEGRKKKRQLALPSGVTRQQNWLKGGGLGMLER